VEWQIKTDSTDVDTDGDGVPDGQEFLDDNTLPNDASDYLPSKPLTDVTAYDGSKDVTVTGTVSKPLIADPSDTSKLLQITDAAAGNVTVKLQAYDEASNSYTDTTYGTATIPFADLVTGNFSINVGANTIPDGTKVVLVSYSPNGKHAVMGDPLSFSVPDKDKYNANGGTVNQDYGTKAKEQDILDAVTVTETKGGQEVPVSADKIQQKAIKGTIPEPSADGSDQTVTVEVTYADGSKEEATVTISYGEAKDKYAPVGQEVSVNKGSQPNAEAGIQNKNDLPQGTTYDWKAPVDTSTPGETTGTVVVTYPDGTKDEVEVKVNVIDARTDTEKYTAQGGTVNKPYGQTATANEITAAVTTDAPQDKVQSIAVAGNIPTQGKNQPVAVTVTYADGTTDTVTVTVTYGDASDVYNPIGQEIPVNKGSQPNAEDGIQNKNDLPQGTTYDWKTPVDTSTPGETTGTIVVTYPDGTKDEVDVTVNVIDPRTDAEKYTAKGQDVQVNKDAAPNAEDGIQNKNDLPQGTTYDWKTPVDTSTPGETTGTVIVTYPDGSKDEVEVKVNVIDPRTDAEKYQPETIPEIIKPGEKPDLSDNVTNPDELPNGTIIKDITPDGTVDTNTPGEYTGTLEITYPDGSKEILKVQIIVAQENEPISNGVGNSMSDNNGNPQSLQNTPKTGDLTNTGLYTAGALGSLTALFGIIVTKKRKKSQKEDIK